MLHPALWVHHGILWLLLCGQTCWAIYCGPTGTPSPIKLLGCTVAVDGCSACAVLDCRCGLPCWLQQCMCWGRCAVPYCGCLACWLQLSLKRVVEARDRHTWTYFHKSFSDIKHPGAQPFTSLQGSMARQASQLETGLAQPPRV